MQTTTKSTSDGQFLGTLRQKYKLMTLKIYTMCISPFVLDCEMNICIST